MTDVWYLPICDRRLGFYHQHLSPRRQSLEPCRQHFAPCRRHLQLACPHFARHPRRLVPSRRHPLLSSRHCERSSTAPQMPSEPLLVSTCPTFVDCPRCPCFRSTSSGTFLNRLPVNQGKPE